MIGTQNTLFVEAAAMVAKCFQDIFLLSVLCFGVVSYSLPLSTQGRWIVDSLKPMLAEGLHKKPLKDIVAKVVQQKFNCVRLT